MLYYIVIIKGVGLKNDKCVEEVEVMIVRMFLVL